ncbi:MAG: hypothetical protein ACLUKN_02785 [Bacilli bacterium]
MGIIMAAMLSKSSIDKFVRFAKNRKCHLENRLPVRLREPLDIGAMLAAMSHDKNPPAGN